MHLCTLGSMPIIGCPQTLQIASVPKSLFMVLEKVGKA